MTTIHPGDRVTNGERRGVVQVVLATPRRGLGGGTVTDVSVRWDGDSFDDWVDPCELMPESAGCDDRR